VREYAFDAFLSFPIQGTLTIEGIGPVKAKTRAFATSTNGEEVRGEIAYMNGRAQEAAGKPDAALAAYATVTQRCRFWAQATYLSGLLQVEKGNAPEGETLLCKVADPKRSATTTPFFDPGTPPFTSRRFRSGSTSTTVRFSTVARLLPI